MNWFKKLFGSQNKISISVTGVNPQTENEYRFFNFVEIEPVFSLEGWYKKSKELGHAFKPQYETAIKEKVKTGKFKNPHDFPEYFNSKFDYIAIDFETANNNRLSACAIGLAFVKDNTFVHTTKHFIKPPIHENFLKSHKEIHGISENDLEFALDFKILWEIEFHKYFNNNLILLHNASMDLSVLKNLFKFYNINNFKIKYIDTMRLAKATNRTQKLETLAKELNLEFNNVHDPEEDAKICANVYSELIDEYPNHNDLIQHLKFEEVSNIKLKTESSLKTKNDNINIIKKYGISQQELNELGISESYFIFSGDIMTDREIAKDFILMNGGDIEKSITKRLNYLIIGDKYGPAKIQKVEYYNSRYKSNIKILTNSDFEFLIKKFLKK